MSLASLRREAFDFAPRAAALLISLLELDTSLESGAAPF